MLAKPQGFPRKLGGCAGLDPRLRSAVSAGVGDGERGLRRGLRAPGVGVRPKWVLEYSPSNKRIRYFVSITYVRTGLWTAHKFCGGGDYFKEDEVTADIFHSAMTAFSSMTAHAVADGYDFSGLQTIVDVGGGHGALLSAIVPTIPGLTGIVYDLPEVVQGTDLGELAEKISTRGGSFLDGVPEGPDAYIMQHIIHDWSDEHCVTILGHCRESMAEGGKVLVLEQVITNAPESAFGKLLDIEMLAMTDGGRERTEAEFEALFAEAGLKMTKIVPILSPVCVVEAVKA